MDDDDRILAEMNDPEWAARVADIEKEFARVDRRRRGPKSLNAPARRPRHIRAVYIWAAIVVAVIAYAAIAQPWGVQQSPGHDQPVIVQNVQPTAPSAIDDSVAASLSQPTS